MSEYNFIEFTKLGSKIGNYTVSIHKSGFSFNSGFYNRENIKQYKKVAFLYDPNKKAIALRFINEDNVKGAFSITHHKGATGSVTARSFMAEHKLENEEFYRKYEPKKIEDNKFGTLFVLELAIKDATLDKSSEVGNMSL